jgi:hypothetical protein
LATPARRNTHNLFIITKLEVVLNNMVLVLLDIVFIKMTLLDLREVPCNDKLPSRRDNSIFFLVFSLVESEEKMFSIIIMNSQS